MYVRCLDPFVSTFSLSYPSLEGGDEGRSDPAWGDVRLVIDVSALLYIPFRIFAYSSNILKVNFDLMDSMSVCGTLK